MKEIQSELNKIIGMLEDVSNQMQELRESIRGAPLTTEELPVFQPYQHPWWQYQWTGPDPSRNNFRSETEKSRFRFDETGSTVSGTTKTT